LFLIGHLHHNRNGGDCKKNNAASRYLKYSYEFYRRLYCYKYGGRNATYDTPNPYPVAIIPKTDIDKGVVDLTKYRFKTWQDGMGIKCE
jgi:hypothetical protein